MSSSEKADTLGSLIAQATSKYGVQDYDTAAALYSQATELQAKINGEMSIENAELLYQYGKCLYQVAVRNSDVLGGKVAGTTREEPVKQAKKSVDSAAKVESGGKSLAQVPEHDTDTATKTAHESSSKGKEKDNDTPFFNFTGDEDFDTDDEDDEQDEEDEEDGQGADDEDDFVNAFEILDFARVLFQKKVEDIGNDNTSTQDEVKPGESRSKSFTDVDRTKERIADIYDLQADISLEGEKFADAAKDLCSALELKMALFPPESSVLAEAHFKYSLALEFSSASPSDAIDATGTNTAQSSSQSSSTPASTTRRQAAEEMQAAIASCKLRIEKEESKACELDAQPGEEKAAETARKAIEDVRGMVSEMEERLAELRRPPVAVNIEQISKDALQPADSSELQSAILAKMSKDSTAGATDLTGLIRRKEKKPDDNKTGLTDSAPDTSASARTGKRSAADDVDDDGAVHSKKTKSEDT